MLAKKNKTGKKSGYVKLLNFIINFFIFIVIVFAIKPSYTAFYDQVIFIKNSYF